MFRLMISTWTNKDAITLGKFLDSDTGRKIKQGFKDTEPDLNATTLEGQALKAAAYRQWNDDKTFIKNALEVQPEEKAEDTGIPVEELDVREE